MASILDTPTSVAAATHTFSVSAGTNRALIVGLTTEGAQTGNHTCTYGGQTMTLVVSEIAGSGSTQQTVSLFFLNDVGIQAASGTTITPGNVPGDISIHAASYQDCVQTTPTNTDSDTTAGSTPNPLANCDIITGAANAVVCTVSGMGNAGSATWAAPVTERTDQPTASANGSYADDEVPTATTIACECTWSNQNRSAIVAFELVHLASAGITDIDPTEFDMDSSSVDINGSNFLASQGTGTVYISDANTLAGSINEVEIVNGINTWSDTVVNLNLTGLNATERANLNTLGPGTRYIILVNNSSDEYGSTALTLHRAQALVMSLGAGTPGATTARLTAPSGKTTADFDPGRFEENANPAAVVDITADNYTEIVWSIEAKILSREVSYDYRVTKNGNVIDTYTVTPQATITAVVSRNITASQIESGDGQAAILNIVIQLDADQTETGDVQAAVLNTIAQVIADQTETGDVQAAVLNTIAQVIADQTEAGDTQTATVQNVIQTTADQTEAGDSQAAILNIVIQLDASQTEAGDVQAAVLNTIAQVIADQTEAGDTQAASINAVIARSIISSQTEAGDTQAAALQNVLQLTADQTEAGDGQVAVLNIVIQLDASQTEAGDTQAADINAALQRNIAADQTEAGDSQAAVLNIVLQLTADQTEAGDTQATVLQNVLQLTVDQTEAGDTQAADINAALQRNITADQTEAGDGQTAVLNIVIQLDASQTEAGDGQAAVLDAIVELNADQTEIGDTQIANINATIKRNIIANQIEAGDTQTAALQNVTALHPVQFEAGDVQAAVLNNVIQLNANQFEAGDTQSADIKADTLRKIIADQIEAGDGQAAVLNNVIQLNANQIETGDTQAAALGAASNITVNQTETGDIQTAKILRIDKFEQIVLNRIISEGISSYNLNRIETVGISSYRLNRITDIFELKHIA